MKSSTTPRFWKAYADLPDPVKKAARKQYALWSTNPRHPSLHFKKTGALWSARITEDYRALAILRNETFYWIWIGTHAEYERILGNQ